MSLFDLPPADAPAAAPRFTFAIDRALVAIGGASVRYLVASVTAPAVPAASARRPVENAPHLFPVTHLADNPAPVLSPGCFR